jgi:hypothetical protein
MHNCPEKPTVQHQSAPQASTGSLLLLLCTTQAAAVVAEAVSLAVRMKQMAD